MISASIFYPEDGDKRFLKDVSIFLLGYRASHLRRQ
jgi:hypothetical protein